ncbi:MAG TPA: hypothetical protein VJN89_17555 [Candidatus Acidoferrum sp.]|nr:hypothetical protein [Candidatus Acidoferrum sp.]
MPKESKIEQAPLTKRALLEYLEIQREPTTAKVASIDLDCRASTVTEMLERCVAQGLAERTTDQRPREYKLSDEGRRRLDSFRSKEGEPPTGSAAEPDERESPRTQRISDLFTRLIDESMEAAFKKRSKQGNHSSGSQASPAPRQRADHLTDLEDAESVTAQSHTCVRELLAIERGLSKLPRQELQMLRDSLRQRIGDEKVCNKVSRLAAAEAELSDEKSAWWQDAEAMKKLLAEISGLRDELGLAEEADDASTGEEK